MGNIRIFQVFGFVRPKTNQCFFLNFVHRLITAVVRSCSIFHAENEEITFSGDFIPGYIDFFQLKRKQAGCIFVR